MKTVSLLSVLTLSALMITVFQNCAGDSLPENALSMSNSSSAATATDPSSCQLDGDTVGAGTVSNTSYLVATAPTGGACPASATLTCLAGNWIGAPAIATSLGLARGGSDSSATSNSAFTSCSGGSTCSVNGTTLQTGQTMTAYSSSTVPFGSTCTSVAAVLTCQNGALVSSVGSASAFTNYTCSVKAFAGTWHNNNGTFTPAFGNTPGDEGHPRCPSSNPTGTACSTQNQRCWTAAGSYTSGFSTVYPAYKCQ